MHPTLLEQLRALGLSGRAAREALSTGKVRVGGVPLADPSRRVDPALVQHTPNAPRLRVGVEPALVWRDEALAVVWKPPGLLSVAAPGRSETNLVSMVARWFGAAHPVHRLDEGTSGLVMVARTLAAQTALKAQLEDHSATRTYLAVVAGHPPARFEVESWLVRDRGDGLRGSGQGPDAKRAKTRFETVERLEGAALVRAELETGRTHQIRIHLSERGYPVLGDDLYGPKHKRRAPRLALHATALAFRHPGDRRLLQFEAPLADDLEVLRRSLGGKEG
jgi:23S rRNA pseudouridine1911/1915/1917 synthase